MKYIMEVWNPKTNKYEIRGEWDNLEWAEKTFNKPYWQTTTRRLIKISEEILYTEKAKKKLNK